MKIIDYVVRKVNVAAAEGFSVSSLLSIHKKPVQKQKYEAISKTAGLIVTKGLRKKVAHMVTGSIDPDFNQVLQKYGYGFQGKEMA